MEKFRVLFSRNPVIVLVLVLVPLATAALFLVPLLMIPNLPDWAVLAGSGAMVAAATIFTLFIIKRYVSIPAEIILSETGFTLRLLRRSLFYQTNEYSIPWKEINNVSTNYDPRRSKCFYQISLEHPRITISLEPDEQVDEDSETEFGERLLKYVAAYNAENKERSGRHIGHKGFYDTWWAKSLTIAAYGASVIAIILYLFRPQLMPSWRLIQLLSFSAVWLAAYHANRYRNSEKRNGWPK